MDYHNSPGINRSRLAHIAKTPAHFKYYEENPPEPSNALIFGQAYHCMLLEPQYFYSRFIEYPDIDRRTKEGKEAYELFLAEKGDEKQALTKSEIETIKGMQAVMVQNEHFQLFTRGGIVEKPIYWTDRQTGELCKCKPDIRFEGSKVLAVIDLKSCEDASTEHFSKPHVWRNFGYDLQAGMYLDGVFEETGKEHVFIFLAQEKKPPYVVNVIEADPLLVDYGRMRFRQLLDIYHKCNQTGHWWGYNGPDGVINKLNLPTWLQYELED